MQMNLHDIVVWAFSPYVSTIVVALLVSLLLPTLVHHYLYRKSTSSNESTFLLIGPSGGGKTTLLTVLANGAATATQTSQESQYAHCQLPSNVRSSQDQYRSEHDTSARAQPKFRLLDTPGHGKLRHHAKSSLLSGNALSGTIFVLDSAAITSPAGLADAAEYLHDMLLALQKRQQQSRTSKKPQAISVLVAANKQDVFTSLPTALVKTRLEAEIARVRAAKSKGLLDSGVSNEDGDNGHDEEQNWLGEYGAKSFSFEQMQEHDMDVSLIGGNALNDDGQVGRVRDWLDWIGQNL